MTEQYIVYLFREAFYTTLLVSAPILVLSLVVGLIISVFQAATSIQEFTLTFVPKLIGVSVVFLLALPWVLQLLVRYTTELFRSLPSMIS